MIQKLTKAITILSIIQYIFCVDQSKIIHLVDDSSSVEQAGLHDYADNYHKMPFSEFQLDPTNPSFTIVGIFTNQVLNSVYSNIFQIYQTSSPNKKLVMFGISGGNIFVRQQYSFNSFQGQIPSTSCSASLITNTDTYFTISLRKTTQIDLDFAIMKGSIILCQGQTSITTSMLNWNFNAYTVIFSNTVSAGSPSEFSSRGSVHSVYLIRDFYIGDYGFIVRRFINNIAQNTQEGISLFNKFNPTSDFSYTCVPDESIVKYGCAQSYSNKLPSINQRIAKFQDQQNIIFKYITYYYLFKDYSRYQRASYITFSFWFYLEDEINTTVSIIRMLNDDNSPFLVVNIIKNQSGSGYFFQVGNPGAIWTSYEVMDIKIKYFIVISYRYFIHSAVFFFYIKPTYYGFQEGYSSSNISFTGNRFSLQVGSNLNSFGTFFELNQFQMNLSAAILFEESGVPILVDTTTIIKNCRVVILVRMKYKCLACKIGYLLYENTCNNTCPSEYNMDSVHRNCVPKCFYRCATCDPSTPNVCTSCSSSDREISTNCDCKKGYEDLISKECPSFRPLNPFNSEVEHFQFEGNVNDEFKSFQQVFTRTFSETPQVIMILQTFKNYNSYLRGIKIKISDITTTSYWFDIQGSLGNNSQLTWFTFFIFAFSTKYRQYYSKFVEFVDLTSNVYYENIDIGTYDTVTHGDYQVLVFLSGLYIGQGSSYTSVNFDFNIEVVNNKSQLKLTVNNYVRLIQISYLVLPDSHPSNLKQYTFNSNTFFRDPLNQYTVKMHTDTISLTHSIMQSQKYLFPFFYSVTGMKMSLNQFQYRLSYSYGTQNNLNEQITRFESESINYYSYSMNGFYLLEVQNEDLDKCRVKSVYASTECFSCKVLYADPNNNCLSCLANRVLTPTSCICPDIKFTKIYDDDIYCSDEDIAVLDVQLSQDFKQLTIDFGLVIETLNFSTQSYPTYDLCKHLLYSDTLNLISVTASCQISQSILIIYLDSDATIMKDNIVNFKQNLKFVNKVSKITQFRRNNVRQNYILNNADVDILYDQEVLNCVPIIIQIKQFLNHYGRGVSNFQWTIDSISPSNPQTYTTIQLITQDVNSNQDLNMSIPKFVINENTTVKMKLEFNFKIGIKNEKIIQFTVKVQSFNLKSNQIEKGPYYRKDKNVIFFSISYSQCDSKLRLVQIDPALFNLQFQTSNDLILQNTISSTYNRDFSITIPPYTTNSNIIYTIKAICQVSGNSHSVQIDHLLPISETPLLASINGGNRQQDYNQDFAIEAQVQDLELNPSLNQPHGITLTWTCFDLQTFQNCRDIEDQLISLTQGSNLISFNKLTFMSFSSLQFTLIGEKNSRQQKSQIVIQFIDNAIPLLQIILKTDQLLKDTININDITEISIIYDQNEDVNKIYFGGSIIYYKEIKSTINFEYRQIRFQIWDYFDGFNRINSRFQIKFIAFNLKYSMPSQTIQQFTLNFPPQNCNFKIYPLSGISLETIFKLQVLNCEDPDQPISYKYFYYTSADKFDFEKKNPFYIQRKQITDNVFLSSIETFLPSGELLLLVQVADIKNAILNITQIITVQQSVKGEQEYINFIQDLIDYSGKQILPSQVLILSLIQDDILQRPLYFNSAQILVRQISNQLNSLTNKIVNGSTFSLLATQTMSQIVKSNILSYDENSILSLQNYVSQILDLAQVELYYSQFLKDKSNQQLYNCFTLLDSISSMVQINKELQQKQIENIERIGNLLNIDALPNESAKILKGQYICIVSQVITSKKISFYLSQDIDNQNWENQHDNQNNNSSPNQIYKNFYNKENEFQSFINEIKAKKPTVAFNEYQVLIPQIKHDQSDLDFVSTTQIKHTFQQIDNEALTCVNKYKDKWTTQGCKSVFNELLKSYNCICDRLTPVTVFNDITDLFDNNKNIDTIISEKGIENILGFKNFYNYSAFWVEFFLTVIFVILSIFGHYFDKQIKPNQTDRPKSSSLSSSPAQIRPMQTTISNQSYKLDESIVTEDIQQNKNTKNNTTEADRPRKRNRTFMKEVELGIKNKLQSIPQKQSRTSLFLPQQNINIQSIKEEESFKLDLKNSIKDGSESSFFSKSRKEKQNNLFEQNEKDKFNSIELLKSICYFHDLFSIFLVYDPSSSRFQRLAIFHMKNLHVFTLNIVFNEQYSIPQTISLQVVNLTCALLLTRLIELGLNKNILIRRIIQFLIFSLVLFYYYAFLAVVSGKDPEATNVISLYYFVVLIIDIFGTGLILAIIQRFIGKYLLKNKNHNDLSGLRLKFLDYIKLQLVLKNL